MTTNLLTKGPDHRDATATLVLLHGRGSSAGDMLGLHDALGLPGVAAIIPEAAGGTWYPRSFLAPLADNEPAVSRALATVEAVVQSLLRDGVPSERIAILGFSQGACLASEFVARHPRRYGGLMALTGGLIGPAGTNRNYPGDLGGMPAFLCAPDPDPHVPFERVTETADVLRRMGASVELKRYPGAGHSVNTDQLEHCRALLTGVSDGPIFPKKP